MLSRLRVQNFRCLRDVTIDFAPLTVLIGKNDSGKTSILDAIRVLGETLSRPIPEVFAGPNHPEVLSWRRTREPIRWELTLHADASTNPRSYELELRNTLGLREVLPGHRQPLFSKGPASSLCHELSPALWNFEEDEEDPNDAAAQEALAEFRLTELTPYFEPLRRPLRHRLVPDALRQPCASTPGAALSPSGNNLSAVLDRIFSGVDSTRRAALERDLHAAIPTLRGLSLRTLDDSTKTIEYILAGAGKRPITIPCENASDGALLVTAYLALAYSDEPGTLLIEEPENGLHPSLLRLVFDVLRKISTGEYGLGPRQVIIATQSPLLLNYATKEEVRIVRRDLETGTSVTPLADVPDIDRLLREFAIGELWYHLGEDALVEGDGAATTERAE